MIIATPVNRDALLPLGFVKSLLILPPSYPQVFEESCSIPLNRNHLFEFARQRQDDLLFIDSDMVFKPEDVRLMAENLKTYDIVTGVAVMAFPGWPPAVFDEALKPVTIKGNNLFEIYACGAAFLGISKKVIQGLAANPFLTLDQRHGEDINFCLRARQAGYQLWCDPRLKIGHIKTEIKYYEEKKSI